MSKAKAKVSNVQLKSALAEALADNPHLLRQTVADVLEDYAMAQAIREGKKSGRVSRQAVLDILQGRE